MSLQKHHQKNVQVRSYFMEGIVGILVMTKISMTLSFPTSPGPEGDIRMPVELQAFQ
jgi:hypothetical protein